MYVCTPLNSILLCEKVSCSEPAWIISTVISISKPTKNEINFLLCSVYKGQLKNSVPNPQPHIHKHNSHDQLNHDGISDNLN